MTSVQASDTHAHAIKIKKVCPLMTIVLSGTPAPRRRWGLGWKESPTP
jgi:hypothetical protein